jgi:hypothetical protein
MNNDAKPQRADEMAIEEWKALSSLIERLENNEFQMRNWLLGLLTGLAVVMFSEKILLPWQAFLGIGVIVVAIFMLMDLVHRMPKRYAIIRSKEVERCLRGELEYDGPRLTSPSILSKRPGKWKEFRRMWENTPYKFLLLLVVLLVAGYAFIEGGKPFNILGLLVLTGIVYCLMKYWLKLREIEIDITSYDKEDNSRIMYFLDKKSFNHPITTIERLAGNPSAFFNTKEYCKILLTKGQNSRFINYLESNNYHLTDFNDNLNDVSHLLAFSFGENPDVNAKLASIVRQSIKKRNISVTVQWEIANILDERNPELTERIKRIDLDYNKEDYITTEQVIQKFIDEVLHGKTDKCSLLVVAQAWHAPRCIKLCKEEGLNVVAGRFSEYFSPNDPQNWVQNPFSWVLKEGTKNVKL